MRPPGRRSKPHAPAAATAMPWVEIGRIVNRHGIRGEVRLLPHNRSSTADSWLDCVRLTDGATSEERRVMSARRHKSFILLQLEGTANADEAEALIGRSVSVRREQLPQLAPGEAYHGDVIGCVVSTEAGRALGTVRELIATGSNDVCVVDGEGREYLIPLIADAIASLDVERRAIVVRDLPGLLDP
jgi:16S rRNA processing protein RimM